MKKSLLPSLIILMLSLILLVSINGCTPTNNNDDVDNGDDVTDDTDNPPDDPESLGLRITNVLPDQFISSPFAVVGEARGSWYFEGSFPVKLLDENGNVLVASYAMITGGEWTTPNFVEFRAELEFDPGTSSSGKLVFEKNNPSGLPENDLSYEMPVRFMNSDEVSVDVYFANTVEDPEMLDCSNVYPVGRELGDSPDAPRDAIKELLKGPTEAEKQDGYVSSFNENVELKSLNIIEGTAVVDFNETFSENMGGSCRVANIYAQLKETLSQFPGINDVEVTVNGQSDVLEP